MDGKPEETEFDSRRGQKNLFFSPAHIRALQHTECESATAPKTSRPQGEAAYYLPSSAELKNAQNFTVTIAYIFMACTQTVF